MGADNSKGKKWLEVAKYGSIYVCPDKTTYLAGDIVSGNIYLNLDRTYPGSQLYLKLKGKEVVHMMLETEDPKTSNIIKEYKNGKHDVINMPILINTINSFSKGQYVVPFSFILPKNLPSSFHQEGECFLANISYRLEAYIQPTFSDSLPRLKHKQTFVVKQPVPSVMETPDVEVTTQLKDCYCFMCCCCVSKGSNKLKVNFEKNSYLAGESAKVKVFLDNTQSQLNTEEIMMVLKQKIIVHAGDKSDTFTFTKSQMKLEKVKAGKLSSDEFMDLPLHKYEGKEYQDIKSIPMKEYLNKITNTHSEHNLSPSTQGTLISSEYFLEVTINMEGWWADSPIALLPIEIHHPEKNSEVVVAPPNWNPVTTPIANISYGARKEKAKQLTATGNTSIVFDSIHSPGLQVNGSDLPTAPNSFMSQAIPSRQVKSNLNVMGMLDQSSMPVATNPSRSNADQPKIDLDRI